MDLQFIKKNLHKIFISILFVATVVLVILLLPNHNTFRYQYEIGKPWSYDLLTASYKFPIAKSDLQIRQEREKILRDFIPFYTLDTAVVHEQFQLFNDDFMAKYGQKPSDEAWIWNQFQAIYAKGIIADKQLHQLKEGQINKINCVLPNKKSHILDLEDVYTINAAEKSLHITSVNDSNQYNLHLYITNNLEYDSIVSELAKNELLKNLSLTSGIVQAGEKIIDAGEIVTEELYLVLESFKKEFNQKQSEFNRSNLVLIGEIIIVAGFILLFFLYINLFRPRIFKNLKNLLFINLLILMMIALSSAVIQFTSVSYYILPFALLPIIVRVFFDARTALFAHLVTVLIVSLMVDNSFRFLLIQIAIGMTAVSSLKDMTQRSQLAQAALIVFIVYCFTYLALEFISVGSINKVHWFPLVYFAISSAFLLFAYLLIYIFEKIFGLISSVTLLELTNINSDLMIQFAEKAPGTFQHTLQVSNLATEAAKKIGANSLLVRTGALYHDIGKMQNPELFIENQHGEKNPLDAMSFEEAAQQIIKHVTDGVAIAKKEHLPEQIIHFITTHHGLGQAKYFYNAFINDNPGIKPDKSKFTYPGPLPDTKETAILMMADAVEARARSLPEYNETSINDCVEDMINAQIAEGQFKKAPLSFRDVETIKAVFKEKIINIYHTRIVYPEIEEENPPDLSLLVR